MFNSPGSRTAFNRLQAAMRRVVAAGRANGTYNVTGNPSSYTRAAGLPGNLFFRDGNSGGSNVGKIDFGYWEQQSGFNCLIYAHVGQDVNNYWASASSYIFKIDNDPYGSISLDIAGNFRTPTNVQCQGLFVNSASISTYLNATLTCSALGGLAIGATEGSTDCYWLRDAAGVFADRDGTNAQAVRIYNTYTDASNYERGTFDWKASSNVLRIGTEKAGTGSVRNMAFIIGGTIKLDYGVTTAAVWTFAAPPVIPGYTVAGLPTGVLGAMARVTDGTASLAWGATVTGGGGGTTQYLVWYNGTNWTVMGK